MTPASFGIMTAADAGRTTTTSCGSGARPTPCPQIEHAWLFDHLLPIGGDPDGPILEGWTLLSALAAQTERLRARRCW